VDVEDVTFHQGDTESAPFGGGTGGSRSAVVAGNAGRAAALELREKVVAMAAHLMESSPEDLEVASGVVSVRGTPTARRTFAELARMAYMTPDQLPPGVAPGLEATSRFAAPPVTFSNAAHLCCCEVHASSGRVTIDRYVVSEDCGVMINPMVVEGQIAGGVVQGIGGVLFEHLIYDPDGNPVTTTFLDYCLPTTAEVPRIEYGHVVTPADTPGGHKGIGEGGVIGAVPAVFNAVADALAPLGVQLRSQPLAPNQIVDALEAAGH
jgi:carbon-monoxide dehydrogenase large subunit